MKYNISKITNQSIEFPNLLLQIDNSPKEIYILGNKEILREKSIAIVGSRDCSKYGTKVAKEVAYNLSKKGIIIVSGLARGIDTAAHQGVIKAKGRTIAVLANGLDSIYPKENKELAIEILKNGGAIISEYPIGTEPLKENFPKRNRIISGLCESAIVVEAKEHSGALITANYAIEQGRNVYAIPGNIYSAYSKGTNELIKNGAEILTNTTYQNFTFSK